MIRLQTTALGTVFSGLRASPPIVDAASKPTREKMQTTTEKSRPLSEKPLSLIWLESIGDPCLNRMKAGQRQDARHRQALQHECQDRRESHVAEGDREADDGTDREQQERADRSVNAETLQELLTHQREPAQARRFR